MANEEQLAILKQGVDVWNRWREENPDVEIDLEGTDLRNINLKFVNFKKANLREVDFRHAYLYRADFRDAYLPLASLNTTVLISANFGGANLRVANLNTANLRSANLVRANFRGAILNGANLYDVNLAETNLCETDLRKAHLNKAYLGDTNLTNSTFGDTTLGDNDLSVSIGLETINHEFPSTIGTDTLQKSKGKIPIEFLRGCGLSDLDIEYAKLADPSLDQEQVALITYEIHRLYCDEPIQFYSCFISYNNKDEAFAQRLHDDLQNSGVRCWFAPEDMKIGDRIRPTIDRQIRMREKLIVILSENSIQSEWVGDEVEAAMEQEKVSGKNVLFPISLDNTVFETRDDWAAKIRRRRSIGNFSKWKDEAEYQKMFDRLLRDLRAQKNV